MVHLPVIPSGQESEWPTPQLPGPNPGIYVVLAILPTQLGIIPIVSAPLHLLHAPCCPAAQSKNVYYLPTPQPPGPPVANAAQG